MKLSRKIISLIFLSIFIVSVGSVSAQESENTIPSWIKAVANAWGTDQITDLEYKNAMEFLIEYGIIQIDTVHVNQVTLSDEAERLYQLEINQKEDRINILEKQVTDVGLDNSKLLQSIVEKDQTMAQLQTDLKNEKADFKKYKDDYPLKVGTIGGKLVNADTIRELETKIQELEEELKEYRQ